MSKFLLDSADIKELEKWRSYVVGMTTNPNLLKKSDTTAQKIYDDLIKLKINNNFLFFHQIVSSKDFITATSTSQRIIYKIPAIKEQYNFIKSLKKNCIEVATTMVYDIIQLQMAINLGVEYSIVLYHKNDNKNFVNEAYDLKQKTNSSIKLIGASFRTKEEVIAVINAGLDYVTVPSRVLEECFYNNQTEEEFKNTYL